MKKQFSIIIVFAFCILSMNLKAYDGMNLTALPKKETPFVLKPKTSDDVGVKDKIIVTGGIGLNFAALSMQTRYELSNMWNGYYSYNGNLYSGFTRSSTPMFNVAVDYGLGKKVSVGVAFGYQTITLNYSDIWVVGDKYYDKWTRIHFAARGDYYIVANENVSLYTGAKIGYNIYSMTTTMPTSYFPSYKADLDVYPNPISAQAHFGFSYFVNGAVGVNAEFGLGYGGPYMLAVGATVKL